MMYTGFELLWLFILYSFLGWVLETVTMAVKKKQFVNRGLVNLPFCVLYGIAAVMITIFGRELQGIWLYIGSMIMATVLEWIAGHLIEKLYHEKWWDYSKIPWNLEGYICLPVSLFWGILAVGMMKWGNPLSIAFYRMLPGIVGVLLITIVAVLLGIDILATAIVLRGKSHRLSSWEKVDSYFSRITQKLSGNIGSRIEKRLQKAYPEARQVEVSQKEKEGFACGCCFYKLVWLFIIGAFLGDITETIFCRITGGVWMSRSSVVWGPFSIVWGAAIAAATLLLYKYQNKSDSFLFLVGTLLGGAYEYICSVFTEIVFGKIFWDYSSIPFNLGGRINLLYCFFWGIAAVVWMKALYPRMSAWIERIPQKWGTLFTWILFLFMCVNILVSCMALTRHTQRNNGVEATKSWQVIMDERFDDRRMERIYPNAMEVESSL